MHIAKHANTKRISMMKFAIAIVLLAACGSLLFAYALFGTQRGQISATSKNNEKQTNKPKNGVFHLNAPPCLQPRFLGIALRTKFSFHNFFATPFDMEVTSQSETVIP